MVAVAYLALAPDLPLPTAGSDAAAARWCAVDDLAGELAFDHTQILADGVERARAKLEYTPLAAAFCTDTFTIAELRHVYEVVWGVELDPRNFHRKVTSTDGFVVRAEGTTTRDGGRPAQLYRVGPADVLRPPLMRPAAPRRTGGTDDDACLRSSACLAGNADEAVVMVPTTRSGVASPVRGSRWQPLRLRLR